MKFEVKYTTIVLGILIIWGLFVVGSLLTRNEEAPEIETTSTGEIDLSWIEVPGYHLEIYTVLEEGRFCFLRLLEGDRTVGAVYYSEDGRVVFEGDAKEFKKGFVETMEAYLGYLK